MVLDGNPDLINVTTVRDMSLQGFAVENERVKKKRFKGKLEEQPHQSPQEKLPLEFPSPRPSAAKN